MKPLSRLLLICALLPLTFWAQNNKQIVSGTVVMTGVDEFKFPSIFLPDYTDAVVMASEAVGYHDSLMLFNANELLYIDFYQPQIPEKTHRLYSVLLKHQPKKVPHYWGQLDIQTPYGIVVMAYPRYVVKDDGSLERVTLYGNRAFDYPRVFALHYGEEYYDAWPLDFDSKILQYLNRDGDVPPGPSGADMDMLFESGFSASDFFELEDMDMGW